MESIKNSLGNTSFVEDLVEIHNITEDLPKLYDKEKFIILGKCNNVVLASPTYTNKTIIQVLLDDIKVLKKEDNFVYIEVGSGLDWSDLVKFCLENDFGGLENLTNIPGSVGAAPVQNIGAYGVELSQVFDSSLVYDFVDKKTKTLSRESCQFSYRDSIFKLSQDYLILKVVFKLTSRIHCLNIGYNGLKEGLDGKLSYQNSNLPRISSCVAALRAEKQPNPNELPNAGSFFKNPLVSNELATYLESKYTELVLWRYSNNDVKISAASLIEHIRSSLDNHKGVGLYSKHSLIVINPFNKSGERIIEFADRIIHLVYEEFGIKLEMEVQLIKDT